MIISKLINQDYIYINLHAEQVITANYLESSREGINVRELNLTTVQNVMADLQENKEVLPKILVLDFSLLAFIQPNIKSNFIELKKTYDLIFVNIEAKIIEDIGFDSITNPNNILEGSIFRKFFFFEENKAEVVGLRIDEESLFTESFKEILKKYKVQDKNLRHTSSFVYISSYIDIKKIITYERNLMLFAIYKLALKISSEYIQTNEGSSVKLVCQSLNGAFITSILSTYLNLDVVIFDKIGPINKLYSRLNKVIEEDAKYVVISDLVCLGTEVKIVKNLIQFLGGKYLGSISLIKVETLKTIKKEDMTTAIFSINRKNNKELGYSINTNLEDIDKNE